MANRKYVYIQLYPKDLMADEKLAKCDRPGAWGAYLALLNIMAMEPMRGCVRLRDWDTRPDNKRYSLVANFEKANSLKAKATAFAKVVSQCTPLRGKSLVEGIEQLISFGVVVMHGDALIQPRMFRESKSHLEGYNPEPETDENPFTDVAETKYYYSAVLWAVENNITGGIAPDKFGPNNKLTREMFVTIPFSNRWIVNTESPAISATSFCVMFALSR